MKILIDIPKDMDLRNYDIPYDILNIITNGTPLPEHHGRLIDADRLTRAEIMHLWYHLPNGDIACPKADIDHAPTIIEAEECDKE